MHENVIIIPIYTGHMQRLATTLGNVAGRLDGTTLVLCASNAWEREFFSTLTPAFDASIEVIDAAAIAAALSPQALQRFRNGTDNCTINLKKLFAVLYCFQHGAKSAISIDSDVVLLPRFEAATFFEVMERNNRRPVLGARATSAMALSINEACRRLILPDTGDHPNFDPLWYGWYFDVPYYTRADFMPMIAHLEQTYPDGWWNHIGWHAFEHMAYTFYRAWQGLADLQCYEPCAETIPDLMKPPQLRAIWSKYDFLPAWISLAQFAMDPTLLKDNPDVMVISHVDRCQFAAT